MAHYAKVVDGTVVQVIVADESFINTYVDGSPGDWIQTSYNTRGGKHYAPDSITEDSGTPIRYNFAGVGMVYDRDKDAFYWPQPYPSWTLNENSCVWEPPTPVPDDSKLWTWNESSKSWE